MKSIRATLAAVALLALVSASSACNSKDRDALLSIMASFPPNPFHPFHSWNSSADCCVWEFVQCSDGRVTLLQITDIDLGGQIPLSLARLPKLTQLFLRNLNLSGPIPRQLSRLRNLDVLYLDNNRLTGTIPASLFSRSNSTDIRLVLSSNSLAGRIPRSFGRLEFAILDLSNNKLTGDASLLFGKSKKAFNIYLGRNRLAFDLTNVEYPESRFFHYLDISHNKIYGSISEQINRAGVLDHFDASYNRLCGRIPSALAHFDASFFAHNHCLCGAPLPHCK